MPKSIPIDEVAETLQALCAVHVLPRFRALDDGDITEKSPGELVTVADRDMERALTPKLEALLPGSRVVGEEAADADPTVLRGLDVGTVWLVDPLDGTANFAAGNPDFAAMVALLHDGEPIASWIWAPVSATLAVAEAGAGAFVNGRRFRAAAAGDERAGVVKTRFLPPDLKQALAARTGATFATSEGSGAAGIDYPALLRGDWRFLMYWRTLAWDHVPGSLLAREAGGRAARLDGTPYRVSDQRLGLLVAPSAACWQRTRLLLPWPGST